MTTFRPLLHPVQTAPVATRRDVRNTLSTSRAVNPLERGIAAVETLANRAAPTVVRLALAAIMLWFGIPKLIPGGSPAEKLAVNTVDRLTFGLVSGDTARVAIGLLEVVLGLALLIGRGMPYVLLAVFGHIAATFTPLLLFPAETWHGPMVGSLEGQYILKNIVILACLVALAGYGMRRRPAARDSAAHAAK